MAKRTRPEQRPLTDPERIERAQIAGAYTAGDGITVSNGVIAVDPAAHVADVASADATDLASAITLVNECKAQINALISALETANLKDTS